MEPLCCQQEAAKWAREARDAVVDAPLTAQVQDQARPLCVSYA